MNLQIFYDDYYFNELEKLISIEKVDPVYPFLEMNIDPDNLISDGYDLTALYNFLKTVHFFYYYDQSHYGYIQLNGKYYIIEVGDEVNILLLGDNEINWTKLLLDDDDFLQFKDFCVNRYNIVYKEPDYDVFLTIKNKYFP